MINDTLYVPRGSRLMLPLLFLLDIGDYPILMDTRNVRTIIAFVELRSVRRKDQQPEGERRVPPY